MNYDYLGKRIREERQRRNMTQAELAEAVGVTTGYIGQIERGEKQATLLRMVAIAQFLDVSLDYMLQDYVEAGDDHIIPLILRLLHSHSASEKEMAYRILLAVFDCYEVSHPVMKKNGSKN